MPDLVPVFDGHNDTLLKLYQAPEPDKEKLFVDGAPSNWHIDLPRARKGGLAGGMFAVFPPPAGSRRRKVDAGASTPGPIEPLPPQLPIDEARVSTLGMASILFRLERAGALAVCRIAADIRVLEAKGHKLCNLTVGDFKPREFPIPTVLSEGIAAALKAGETN